jgi:outer membrane lipoprotein SlyB
MTLSTPLRKVASKLMAKFGGEVTIRTVTAGAYNTTTGAITETVSDTAVRGVLEDVNAREVNELVQAGDKRLTIAAADTAAVPSTADRVVISNISHQVIRVVTIEQDNEPITYELILRA